MCFSSDHESKGAERDRIVCDREQLTSFGKFSTLRRTSSRILRSLSLRLRELSVAHEFGPDPSVSRVAIMVVEASKLERRWMVQIRSGADLGR